jgi:hypothetical protein
MKARSWPSKGMISLEDGLLYSVRRSLYRLAESVAYTLTTSKAFDYEIKGI